MRVLLSSSNLAGSSPGLKLAFIALASNSETLAHPFTPASDISSIARVADPYSSLWKFSKLYRAYFSILAFNYLFFAGTIGFSISTDLDPLNLLGVPTNLLYC